MSLANSDTITRLRLLPRYLLDSLGFGRPKNTTHNHFIILSTKSKLYLEYEGTTAVEMGPPSSVEFQDKKIVIVWKNKFPLAGILRKYIVWTELAGFREFDFGSNNNTSTNDYITVTYVINCYPG